MAKGKGQYLGHSASYDGGENEFYPTPPEATQAIINHLFPDGYKREYEWEPDSFWEPCCGNGAMDRVMRANGMPTRATDLIDRGYEHGKSGVDFLNPTHLPERRGPYVFKTWVITNPPFSLAADFLRMVDRFADGHDIDRVCFLLKTDFMNAACRADLFKMKHFWHYGLLPFSFRPDFSGGGGNSQN
ncbi:MAG: hypothetical protein ORO03_06010 [Alphaproteobacteria bacterium]|nr:hypothetical protein [Alphaproteobacteria bacterium]